LAPGGKGANPRLGWIRAREPSQSMLCGFCSKFMAGWIIGKGSTQSMADGLSVGSQPIHTEWIIGREPSESMDCRQGAQPIHAVWILLKIHGRWIIGRESTNPHYCGFLTESTADGL